jgi:hypothetical protein
MICQEKTAREIWGCGKCPYFQKNKECPEYVMKDLNKPKPKEEVEVEKKG